MYVHSCTVLMLQLCALVMGIFRSFRRGTSIFRRSRCVHKNPNPAITAKMFSKIGTHSELICPKCALTDHVRDPTQKRKVWRSQPGTFAKQLCSQMKLIFIRARQNELLQLAIFFPLLYTRGCGYPTPR